MPNRSSTTSHRERRDGLFRALSDEKRLELLAQLRRQGRTDAGSLARTLGWSRDGAAKRLSQLRRTRILRSSRSGKLVLYELSRQPVLDAASWVAGLWTALGDHPQTEEYPDRKERAALASALTTDGRRRMLEFVCRNGRSTQTDLVRGCQIDQPLASRDLVKLQSSRLVRSVLVDGVTFYEADPEGLSRLVRWFGALTSSLQLRKQP